MFAKQSNRELNGMPASAGKAKGQAFVINHLCKLDSFPNGGVLVANETDPSMVIAMSKASAIITSKGGITCHAAIVSRELGIPCIVGVKGVTAKIVHGEMILVDGDTGKIIII